jgi:hypothetical protein
MKGAAMNETTEAEFIVDRKEHERDYPVGPVTGWETIVFQLDDDPEPQW